MKENTYLTLIVLCISVHLFRQLLYFLNQAVRFFSVRIILYHYFLLPELSTIIYTCNIYALCHAESLWSCPILCNPMGQQPARLLCPWDSPGNCSGLLCPIYIYKLLLEFLADCINMQCITLNRIKLEKLISIWHITKNPGVFIYWITCSHLHL